jgi:hypothetical protein
MANNRRAEQRQQDSLLKAEVSRLVHSGNFSLLVVHQPSQAHHNIGGTINSQPEKIVIRDETITGDLPFQGSAQQSSYHTSSGAFKFNGDPIKHGTIKERKRNYLMELTVEQPGETFHISVEIGFLGNVSMQVRSNRRATTTFQGVIQP